MELRQSANMKVESYYALLIPTRDYSCSDSAFFNFLSVLLHKHRHASSPEGPMGLLSLLVVEQSGIKRGEALKCVIENSVVPIA